MDKKDISLNTPVGTPRVFVSYSHDSDEHKGRVLELAERLRKDGLDCHIDQYEVSPKIGWPLWMAQQIEEATFVLVVFSELYNRRLYGKEESKKGHGSNWEGGIITQLIYEQGGKNNKFIPVVFTHQDTVYIPVFLRPYPYYDLSSVEGYGALYSRLREKPIVESFASNPPLDNFLSLRESLRKRLLNDFFTEGVFKGQFGKNLDRRGERHYQSSQSESLKVKPAYYLTYWGWRVAKRLLPEMFDEWSVYTYLGINERFAGGRWIKVQLQDYEAQTSLMRTVETIRHTARAAEIMLMIDKGHSIVRQVAMDLIQGASSLQNPDGGWKEFRVGNQVSSLYSSLYVFHFLSTLRSQLLSQPNVDFFKDFVEENSACIDKTEEYLKTHWKTQKWKYGSLPWEVSAPGTLSEYAPYALNLMLVQQVSNSITELLNKNGRLIHPDIGVPFDAPEYSLTVRIVYALWCAKQKLQKSDDRIDAAISWLRESYSPGLMLNTCDIAFLSEMLLEN